jgi:molecular chaperone DnaK
LREAAIDAKHRLSTQTEVAIDLPFYDGEKSLSLTLTRAELERIARPIVERTRNHCLRSLADAKLSPADLDQVILVGGQTRMPLVREFVRELFGREPNTSQNPDEAVALGATIQAGILGGTVRDMVLLDITPLSLGIETFGGLMNVIIPRNSTIPIKAGEMFTTAVDHQPEMLIHVLQGERERAKDNWSLGRFTLDFPPAAKGLPRVGVQFEIDANGILHVLARDTKTGRQKIVEMKSAVDVSDTAVQQMVEESVEHAFDDLKARQWIEVKLRAVETLQAARKGVADCAGELDADYKTKVEAAMSALEAALASEDLESKTGDPIRLKAANAALDEATRPLADLLMEKAMDAMLRQKGLIG